MRDSIIDKLRRLVEENEDEQSLIFLGDYVYHFAYDRKSLLLLFRFFVELYHQGKNVYVLAGNHDWISEQFVYEEGKMATEMMLLASHTNSENATSGMLKFITEVEECVVDGEKILFFPYTIDDEKLHHSDTSDQAPVGDGVLKEIASSTNQLLKSKYKGEIFSGRINQTLLEHVISHQSQDTKKEPLLVIHHYYLEGVQFPGQRGRFGFKDVAIDRRFAQIDDIRMISGHIHQPFVHHNYVCLGSLRATSPLEINQYKVAGLYSEGKIKVLPLTVNAYMRIENHEMDGQVTVLTDGEAHAPKKNTRICKETLIDEQNKRWKDLQNNMLSTPFWSMSFGQQVFHDQKMIKLQLIVDRVDYNVMDDYIDEDLQVEIGDIQLKKKGTGMDALVEKMSLADKNLREGFADWKEVLKLYLSQKYGSEDEEYLEILRDLKLL